MKKLLVLALALGLLGGSSSSASARDIMGPNLTKPSSNTDVALLFYKMIGVQPKFDEWFLQNEAYKKASDDQKSLMMKSEGTRLQLAYNGIDTKKAIVTIRTVVQVRLVASPDKAGQKLELTFPASGPIYFPYLVGDQTVSVIPNGIDFYRSIPLTAPEATITEGRIPPNGKATLVLEIKPIQADGKNPIMLGGIPQWLMIGEIGFLGLYNDSADTLWSFQAPWHTSKTGDSLLSLRAGAVPTADAIPSQPAGQP